MNDTDLNFISTKHHYLHTTFLLWVCVFLFSGCAALSQPKDQSVGNYADTNLENKITISESKVEGKNTKGWWQVGFHRNIEDEEEVQWFYDSFLALSVLKPIIVEHQEVNLWRFHRRAAPDKSGHKFSYIFYATRDEGQIIYQQVNNHPILKQLLAEKYIDRISFYDINAKLRPGIGDTSDKKWPIELQKSWPYFIMGVSQTWLSLVEHYYDGLGLNDSADLNDQLEGHKQVSADLDRVWGNSGSHAFLHHLNALFAYQELYILEHRRGRF